MSWPFGPSASFRESPPAELGLALAEKRPREAAERLGQGGVRDVALVLVELARREQAARRDERLVEFVHDRRFADAVVAGDEHEFGCAIRYDPVESAEQRSDLMLPAVELLRDEQSVRRVVSAECERLDAKMQLPLREALPQIDRETRHAIGRLGISGAWRWCAPLCADLQMLDPRKPPELPAGLRRATILMTGPAGELGITTTGVAAVFDVGRDSSRNRPDPLDITAGRNRGNTHLAHTDRAHWRR